MSKPKEEAFSLSLQGKEQSDSEGSSPLTVTTRVGMFKFLFSIGFHFGIQKVSNFFC